MNNYTHQEVLTLYVRKASVSRLHRDWYWYHLYDFVRPVPPDPMEEWDWWFAGVVSTVRSTGPVLPVRECSWCWCWRPPAPASSSSWWPQWRLANTHRSSKLMDWETFQPLSTSKSLRLLVLSSPVLECGRSNLLPPLIFHAEHPPARCSPWSSLA